MNPRTLALASLLALAVAASAQTPPKDLHQVGDHWTAWDPPTSFPEGTQVYTIVPGDTLWDLAQKNLGDPYLWPQIWERNRYILDAHWIYPGDPLLLNLQVAEPEAPTPAETTELEPTEPETTIAQDELAPEVDPEQGRGRDRVAELPVRAPGQRRRHLLQRLHRRARGSVPLPSWREASTSTSSRRYDYKRHPQADPRPLRHRRDREVRSLPRRHRVSRSGQSSGLQAGDVLTRGRAAARDPSSRRPASRSVATTPTRAGCSCSRCRRTPRSARSCRAAIR